MKCKINYIQEEYFIFKNFKEQTTFTEKAHAEPKEFPSNSIISINYKHLH